MTFDYLGRAYRKGKRRLGLSRELEEERLEAMVGPPGIWRESRDFQIDFLKRLGLQPHHTLLDIGCGNLRGGIPLIKYLNLGNYTGIDSRAYVVDESHLQIKKAKLENKKPVVITSNSFGSDELDGQLFDYIWCFQVLYHLKDDLADSCISQIHHFMGHNSVCFANVNTLGKEGKWKEFPYVRRSLDFYESLANKHSLIMRDLGELKQYGYTQKVPGQFNNILEFKNVV